jgi:NitT/TauT family transport system ATP-binding protein
MIHLIIDSLSKSYLDEYRDSTVEALRDVTFEVEKGEFVALLGPSGCGKTTVLNIIAGFIEPSSGQALLRGKPIRGPGPDRGVVFQSFALFPWKTVLGNITFGLKVRGVGKPERERTAREYIELVGLTGFEDRYPHELSGGMQQRVGVARVLANSPEVMLMDEPFASVDAQTRMKLQEDLTQIWEQHKPTIVFVTHDIEEAVFLADRVIVLSSRPGRIQKILDVRIPRPRRWEYLVEDQQFTATVHHIMGLIVSRPEEPDEAPA